MYTTLNEKYGSQSLAEAVAAPREGKVDAKTVRLRIMGEYPLIEGIERAIQEGYPTLRDLVVVRRPV